MQPIQFDPKITTDLQIDRRRPGAGQTSELFADLLADKLKRRLDTDRREPDAKRHRPASDPVSGQPPRLTITHARTLRGEAKRVEEADARLTDQTHRSVEDGCAEAVGEAATAEESAADAGSAVQDEATKAPAGIVEIVTVEIATEEPVVDEQAQSADPAATVVVATQPTEQSAGSPGPEIALLQPAPVSASGENVEPAPAEKAADQTSDGSHGDTEAVAKQQSVAAMAEVGLSEVAASLNSGEAAPADNANAPVIATQTNAKPAPARATGEPLLQTLQTPAAVVDLAPRPAQRPADRSSMDIKLRQGASVRTPAASPNATPNAAAVQSAPPHQPAPLQPGATGELGSLDDMFEQPFSPDESGPGWTLHLAQGATSKRADFIAQLRQHLQNLPAHEQVAVHVQRAVREGIGRLSVQLSPAELGRIHVKLEIDEDKRVTAAVTVERPSTLELLQRDIKGLERALHNAGLTMEGGDLSFSLGRGSDQEFADDLNQSAASATDGSVLDAESEGDQPTGLAAQVMDTAAGVVNLQV